MIIYPMVQAGHNTLIPLTLPKATLPCVLLALDSQWQGVKDVPTQGFRNASFFKIWILNGKDEVVCNRHGGLGWPSLGPSFKSLSVSCTLLAHLCRNWESVFREAFRMPLYCSIRHAPLDCRAGKITTQCCFLQSFLYYPTCEMHSLLVLNNLKSTICHHQFRAHFDGIEFACGIE